MKTWILISAGVLALLVLAYFLTRPKADGSTATVSAPGASTVPPPGPAPKTINIPGAPPGFSFTSPFGTFT